MRTSDFTIENLTNTFLNECFSVDAEKGKIYWKSRPCHHFSSRSNAGRFNGRFSGKEAGALHWAGYIRVSISKIMVGAHRLVWAISNGVDLLDVPPILDHINGIRTDNRIVNLRGATPGQSSRNRTHTVKSATGVRGVAPNRHGCPGFVARISFENEEIGLGVFKTIEEARAAYFGAARVLHGDFMRPADLMNITKPGGA